MFRSHCSNVNTEGGKGEARPDVRVEMMTEYKLITNLGNVVGFIWVIGSKRQKPLKAMI